MGTQTCCALGGKLRRDGFYMMTHQINDGPGNADKSVLDTAHDYASVAERINTYGLMIVESLAMCVTWRPGNFVSRHRDTSLPSR